MGWQRSARPAVQAALLVRLLPNSMVDGSEAIRIGGYPRLPQGAEWPARIYTSKAGSRAVCEHFVAEIDFGKLPRACDGTPMPDMPEKGLLSLFLPLGGDLIYMGHDDALVYFWPGDPSEVSERKPPENMERISGDDYDHVNQSGVTDAGLALVPQVADVVPFVSYDVLNPLIVNMSASSQEDIEVNEATREAQQVAIDSAKAKAQARRPLPPHPCVDAGPHSFWQQLQCERIPDDIKRRLYLEPEMLDWEFVFDWCKAFLGACFDIAITRHERLLNEGENSLFMRWVLQRRLKALTKQSHVLKGIEYEPLAASEDFMAANGPALTDYFDRQATHLFGPARYTAGVPSKKDLAAFVDMLVEIQRHYEETDEAGYSLDTRIRWLEQSITESDAHAGHTNIAATDALKVAYHHSVARRRRRFEALSLSEQWDCHIIDAANAENDPAFSSGPMPLQMFGCGFEMQHAVSDHEDDVLLFQFGDGMGTPLNFGPGGLVQLWISQEDLANARFDRVKLTFEIS